MQTNNILYLKEKTSNLEIFVQSGKLSGESHFQMNSLDIKVLNVQIVVDTILVTLRLRLRKFSSRNYITCIITVLQGHSVQYGFFQRLYIHMTTKSNNKSC